jgi:hypothetical protein
MDALQSHSHLAQVEAYQRRDVLSSSGTQIGAPITRTFDFDNGYLAFAQVEVRRTLCINAKTDDIVAKRGESDDMGKVVYVCSNLCYYVQDD